MSRKCGNYIECNCKCGKKKTTKQRNLENYKNEVTKSHHLESKDSNVFYPRKCVKDWLT